MQFLRRPDEGSPEWVGEKKGRGNGGVGSGAAGMSPTIYSNNLSRCVGLNIKRNRPSLKKTITRSSGDLLQHLDSTPLTRPDAFHVSCSDLDAGRDLRRHTGEGWWWELAGVGRVG